MMVIIPKQYGLVCLSNFSSSHLAIATVIAASVSQELGVILSTLYCPVHLLSIYVASCS